MSFKANIIKKFRHWLNQRIENKTKAAVVSRNSLSFQVGKLLQSRGSEIITMTTL